MSKNKKLLWTGTVIAILLIIMALLVGVVYYQMDKKNARHKQLGSQYLLSENYKMAAEEYLKAIELSPDDLVLYFQLAEAFTGLKDYSSAAKYLKEAIGIEGQEEIPPDQIQEYVSLYVKLADCYSQLDQEAQSVETLQEGYLRTGAARLSDLLQTYAPDKVDADIADGDYHVTDTLKITLSASGEIYYTMDGSKPDKNSLHYKDELILEPGSYQIKAITYNVYDLASEVADLTYTVEKADFLREGMQQLASKEYERAKKSFDLAIQNNNREIEAYLGKAEAAIGLKDYQGAIQILQIGETYQEDEKLSLMLSALMPKVDTSKPAGIYESDQVEILLSTKGKKIYYTTDGSIPTQSSILYQTPIIMKGDLVLQAVALGSYGNLGEIQTFEYHLKGEDRPKSTEDVNAGKTKDTVAASPKKTSDAGKQPAKDQKGEIIWQDKNVEAVVRKVLGQDGKTITKQEAKAYKGSLDLSRVKVETFKDLLWFDNLTSIICNGNQIQDGDELNQVEADRVIAVYRTIDDVNKITNVSELKKVKHFGIQVSDFSIGDMSMSELLEFFTSLNQVIGQLDHLEYLDLSNNGLTDITLLAQIYQITQVKYLILKNNELSDITVLGKFNRLIYLDITNNKITDFTPVKNVTTVIGKKSN